LQDEPTLFDQKIGVLKGKLEGIAPAQPNVALLRAISGGVQRFGPISQRGPSVVRGVLVEAAQVMARENPELRKY
jgi:hypothetical protein